MTAKLFNVNAARMQRTQKIGIILFMTILLQ
jgi:hypothetical protein